MVENCKKKTQKTPQKNKVHLSESIEIKESVKSVVDILHFDQITSVIIAIVMGICVLIGILIRGLFIYYIQYKAPNDRPINKMILCDQVH